MRKQSLLLTTLFSGALLYQAALVHAETEAEEQKAESSEEKAIATVNDAQITQETFQTYLERFPVAPGADMQPDKKAVLQELINRELVVQDAQEKELADSEAFKEKMAQLKRNALFEFGIQNYLDNHPITEEQLKEAYKEFKPLKQYKARHILIKTQEEGMAIINQLQQGANFAQLAMQRSIDPMSRPQGGDLGWLTPGQMLKTVADVVVNMNKGQLTLQPVQSHVGWHVILVEDIRDLPPLPFEAAKEQLKTKLSAELVTEYLKKLKEEAEIEINEAQLK